MAQIVGAQTIVGSVTGITQAQRIVAMDKTIHLLEPNKNPLTVLTNKISGSRPTGSPKFEWLEDILAPKTLTGDGTGAASGGASLTLAAGDGSKVAAFDVVKNPSTGEQILVTAVSTDTLTITRAFGATAAAAIAANQPLLIIGNANKENATVRDILAQSVTSNLNYAQIFRTPLGFSRVTKDSDLYGGNYKERQLNKKGIEHAVEIERMYLFGEPKEVQSTDGGRWATAGIDYYLTSNRYDCGGALTYSALLDFCQQVFRYGSQGSRVLIAAPIVVSALDSLAANKLITQVGGSMFGVHTTKITTSHGDLMVVKHPLLSETGFYNERAYALDMEALEDRPFTNAKTKMRMNIQAPSADGETHEYLTQSGLQVIQQQRSGVLYNVTSF